MDIFGGKEEERERKREERSLHRSRDRDKKDDKGVRRLPKVLAISEKSLSPRSHTPTVSPRRSKDDEGEKLRGDESSNIGRSVSAKHISEITQINHGEEVEERENEKKKDKEEKEEKGKRKEEEKKGRGIWKKKEEKSKSNRSKKSEFLHLAAAEKSPIDPLINEAKDEDEEAVKVDEKDLEDVMIEDVREEEDKENMKEKEEEGSRSSLKEKECDHESVEPLTVTADGDRGEEKRGGESEEREDVITEEEASFIRLLPAIAARSFDRVFYFFGQLTAIH